LDDGLPPAKLPADAETQSVTNPHLPTQRVTGQRDRMVAVEQILVVEDDRAIRELVSKFLVENGFRVTSVANGRDMDRELHSRKIDLIVLDIMLPGESGDNICRRLRKESGIPIIMLTARGEEIDRVLGLELGADDYVTKPFSPRELLARIRAVLRRFAFTPALPLALRDDVIGFAEWRLLPSQRQLTDPTGARVILTSAEFDLLTIFCSHAGQVLSRDKILDLMHGRVAGPFERSVDILVSRLRHKIENDSDDPQIIQTVRGSGYLFTARVA
jgi:two-component system, OmpR family, response regulator